MTTTIDAAWRELEADALASDGPIRDSDVKNAIKRNRPHIEREAVAAWLGSLDTWERLNDALRVLGTPERPLDATAILDALVNRSHGIAEPNERGECLDCGPYAPCQRHDR